MRTTTRTCLLALAALVAISRVAAAQPLFEPPGAIELVPTAETFQGTRYFGQDKAGYVYNDRGGFSCHPAGDAATEYGLGDIDFFDANGTRVGFRTYARPTPDGSGFDVAYFPLYPYWQKTNKEALRVFRVSCAALAAGSSAEQLGGTIMVADSPLLARVGSVPEFDRSASGALCFPTMPSVGATEPDPNGIICIDLATQPPTVTQLVDATTLDAALDVDPAFAKGAYRDGVPPTYEYWTLQGLVAAPGDRLFFIADRHYESPSAVSAGSSIAYSWRWVVERKADGTLATRFGPLPASSSWHPLLGAGELVYSAELDAVLAWPVLHQEYNAADYAAGGLGWSGIGFRVIPLDAPGSGYLPLSRPFAARLACADIPSFCNRFSDTNAVAQDGGVQVTVWHGGANPNSYEHEVYTLQVDKDALDLDDDGLDAAAEAAAGTWDSVPDSDGGGTPDGAEVQLSRTDPNDANGEPANQRRIHGTLHYVPSALIRSRAPVSSDDIRKDNLRTVGVDGPLCAAGHCYGPEGEVASYPISRQRPGTFPVVAADGTFVMLETDEGLVRFYFEDGREELAVARATLDATVPATAGGLRVFPIDAERTFVANDGTWGGALDPAGYPVLVALAQGTQPLRIVYDHAQAQRDSGLAVSEDDLFDVLDVGVTADINVIGWDDETQQLHIGVRGNWDSYLIGVGGDGSATLLGRGRARAGVNGLDWRRWLPSLYEPYLPPFMLPTGHGDYFTTGGIMEPFGSFADARIQAMTGLERPPLGIWGDVVLESVCCGFEEDGVYELVRYDQSVAAGDVLLMAEEGHGAMMLYKSGPRGGLAPLWPAANPDIHDASGIDLAPDGSMRLCVADAVDGVVWELEPAGPEGAPEIVRYSADVPGIVDCAYDASGTLSVLATGPARVEARDGDFGDLAVAETLPPAPEPIELVRRPDGTNEVRVRDGLRGKAYLADGRALTMSDDEFTLRLDGVPIGDFPRLVFINHLSDVHPDYPARVALAVRPDGLVMLAPTHAPPSGVYAAQTTVYLVDPAGGSYSLGTWSVGGVVTVPGGVNADPWTGRVRGPAVAVPPGVVVPDPPSAPAGGEPVASDDGGCAGGAPGATMPWALLAACLGLWSRGTRRQAR